MGSQLTDEHSNDSFGHGHPRCSWSLLNLIKYQHWHSIMKILVHRRRRRVDTHDSREDDPENEVTASMSNELQDQKNAEIEGHDKGSKSPISTKNSVKARIKSRIAEEISKRKGKHQKRSTSPARSILSRTDSFHRLKNSVLDPLNEAMVSDGSPLVLHEKSNENSWVATCGESDSINKSCEHNHIGENRKQVLEIQNFGSKNFENPKEDMLEQRLLNVKKLVRDDLHYHSKEFQDVFDTINVNKHLLLTILQNPGSRVVNNFSKNTAGGAGMGLTKSGTFPVPDLVGKRIAGPSKLRGQQEKFRFHGADRGRLQNEDQAQEDEDLEKPAMPSLNEHQREINSGLSTGESDDSNFPGSSHCIKNHSESQMVRRRFKDLRKKIKHVIEAGKEERHRIIRDAIFHKIPHGHGFSKAIKKPVSNKTRDSAVNRESKYSPVSSHESEHSHSHAHYMSRTLSLNESLDRYCQLYETSFNQEGKQYKSERLRLTPQAAEFYISTSQKSLGRIYSLPDLNSYFYQREDSIDAFSSLVLKKKAELSRDNVVDGMAEQSNTQEILGKVREEESSISVPNFETIFKTNHIEDEASSIFDPEADFSEDTFKEVEPNNGSSYQFLEVDAKDRADYNYVRDVLELSGLCGNGLFLDAWHSKDQPVDPSVYDQVEGCWVLDPDCAGNEEGGKCDHLLLFDLINEVLIEIYRRSHRHRSMPVLSIPPARWMMKGHHILKEVWDLISWYLSFLPQLDHSVECVVSRDIEKGRDWLDLHFDAEFVGLELEDLIFDELLEEAICI